MKAILFDQPGGAEVLYIGECEAPQPQHGELLVNIHATALNRADLLQREGKYPPPPGASTLLGLEMAGTVAGWGSGVTGFEIGDPVCALLPGGGYAQQVCVPAALALRLPGNLSFSKAAAIPETFLTAFQALDFLAHFKAGERILIHAGASGVGTAAIQLAKLKAAGQILVTASLGKHELCAQLGADVCIDYKSTDFASTVMEATGGKGVDVILDFVGAPYLQRNLSILGMDGRLVILAFMGGALAEQVSVADILRKRLQIIGTTLRNRDLDYKIKLTEAFSNRLWPYFANRRLYPVVDTIYDWENVADAHRYMESNANTGKLVLTVSSSD